MDIKKQISSYLKNYETLTLDNLLESAEQFSNIYNEKKKEYRVKAEEKQKELEKISLDELILQNLKMTKQEFFDKLQALDKKIWDEVNSLNKQTKKELKLLMGNSLFKNLLITKTIFKNRLFTLYIDSKYIGDIRYFPDKLMLACQLEHSLDNNFCLENYIDLGRLIMYFIKQNFFTVEELEVIYILFPNLKNENC